MKNPVNPSRYVLSASLLAILLSACATDPRQTQPQTPAAALGADRDQHACIGSAGYAWCERENACVRPWELASKKGFELNAKAFERYCANAPQSP